jgi:hypothetical protein
MSPSDRQSPDHSVFTEPLGCWTLPLKYVKGLESRNLSRQYVTILRDPRLARQHVHSQAKHTDPKLTQAVQHWWRRHRPFAAAPRETIPLSGSLC